MRMADTLASAVWGAISRPARTAALVAALSAGVAATVFVAAVISGFSQEIDRLAFGAYARALVIRENGLVIDRHGPPALDDQSVLQSNLEGVQATAAWNSSRAQIYDGGDAVEVSVFGVSGDYNAELDSPLQEGRFLTLSETEGYARLCLVGVEAALQLGISSLPARNIRLNGVDCEVVGILGEPNSRPAAKFAQSVIVPFRAAERYFSSEGVRAPTEADWLTVIAEPGTDMRLLEMEADLLLRKENGAPLARASPFAYGDAAASLDQVLEQRSMLSRLLGTLAVLCLGTSLIAYGAISASAMTSRQREIALRLSMGASARDIQKQILLENGILGVAGGALGLGFGALLSLGAARLWGWPSSFEPIVAALAVVLGTGVGLTVGVTLAKRAAALAPSIAARP